MTPSTEHIDRVFRTVSSDRAATKSLLAASWKRSMTHYGLDPAQRRAKDRLDQPALSRRKDRVGQLLDIAMPKLDQLFGLVCGSGCGVLLTDEFGLVLDQRRTDADAGTFDSWGLSPGADWSEAAEGTNGIGTCLAETRRLTIHRGDHFLARNISMSCMDAPIFGPDGAVVAALDISSARADQTEGMNRLIAATVAQTARAIESDLFRAYFPKARIIVADSDDDAAVLLAVDADDLVIGATRAARRSFQLEPRGALKPRPAADLFDRGEDEPSGFEKAQRAAVVRALTRAEGNVSQAARALGIGRATLYRRMKRLGMS
ncbi:GAF domain-containing protein [Citreicella sp. C3M06]|uniref:helix-turn-helix domain-containing protein n=1 Tax=Citreicella sp. C3M06 TaxID=2841564 RepID=UPI001C0A5EFE|nr:helix-turn-helix domain-containing protein [Citreicella sp. C3M06]MBU2960623.1 GAF domain-containing protein [Citreicella sp. C3M06]